MYMYMYTKEIIENELGFLINDYGFKFSYENNRGETYIYENSYGAFKYYVWEQFDEEEFSVKYDFQFKVINLQIENPKRYSEYLKIKKSFKYLFKDKRQDYWNMVSDIIKEEINNNGSIFGLKV